jgi:hypothetical protein
MGKLFDFLVNRFNICPIKSNITALDSFRLYVDMDSYQSALKSFEKTHINTMTPLEKYILMMETDPLKRFAYIFSQNHHVNYFISIFLILSNPDRAKGKIFDILYDNKNMMNDIAVHVKDIWRIIVTEKYDDVELKTFYNQKMIDMFLDNLVFKKLENMGARYDEFWNNHFFPATQSVRCQIQEIYHLFSPDEDLTGVYVFNPDLYRYMFKQNVGLDLYPEIMMNYAYKVLEKNRQDCIRIGKHLYKKDTSYDDLYTKISSEPDQTFHSDQDIIDSYVRCMDMYKKIYIEDQGFPVKMDVKIFPFSNPNMSRGIYDQGTFYLNLADRTSARRYDVETLVLHETIPGHHLQIDISTYSSKVDPLSFLYGSMMNGFAEGWGLLAESMYHRSSLSSRQSMLNEYRRLQMNNMRTYRVIADIKMHVYGVRIKTIRNEMKKYVKMSDMTINTEIYRYRAMPGQAPCYKLGEMILSKINRSKYKALMINGWVPLCFIEI